MTKLIVEKLKQNLVNIIDLWEQRAIEEIEAAQLQKKPALRNELKAFLEQLIEELSYTPNQSPNHADSKQKESCRLGKKHGKRRAESIQYTIGQLIYEYHILRQTICKVLRREGVLNLQGQEIIIDYIERAVNNAAIEFSKSIEDMQGQFSRTLAHDLRSPISVAKLSAELILRRPDDKDNCIDKAGRISINMDRIDRMIRDLLDMAKMKAGEELSVEFKECDLDWIIREVAFEANLNQADKVKVLSKGPTLGFWNEDGLRRIVENLANNAIKYGYPGTPVIFSLSGFNDYVSLKVHNMGLPISNQDRQKLFQPFHRAESSEEKIGWGIGLTVVKSLVEIHKGEIAVESNMEEGTTFSLTLPIDPRNCLQPLHH